MTAGPVIYLRWWLVLTCSIVLAAVAINLVVDPYGVYRIVDIDGFNRFKSRAVQREYLFKLYLVERVRPAAVILGNSRAEVGLDPDHPAFARAGGPAANVAMAGTGIGTTVQYLRHAIAVNPPKVAVVGLEFQDARTDGDPERAQRASRTAAIEMNAPLTDRWRRAASHVDTLASVDAVYDSINTLRDNRRQDTPGLTARGLNPMREYAASARVEGYRPLFVQRDLENAGSYARGPKEVFVHGTRTAPYFEAVRALADLCRKSGIELHLVIYPYHAHILELFHTTGLWGAFEDWKRELLVVLQDEAAHHGAGSAYPLWDFSGYGEFATERVPPQGDRRTRMQWYWEAGHFKKELGDIMLDRIFGVSGNPGSHENSFGVLLTRTGLEEHLAVIRAGRAPYRHSHADEASSLDDLARMVKESRER